MVGRSWSPPEHGGVWYATALPIRNRNRVDCVSVAGSKKVERLVRDSVGPRIARLVAGTVQRQQGLTCPSIRTPGVS